MHHRAIIKQLTSGIGIMSVEGDPGLRRRRLLTRWSSWRHRYSRALGPYIANCMRPTHVVVHHRAWRTSCCWWGALLHHERRRRRWPVVSLLDEDGRLWVANYLSWGNRRTRRNLVLLQLLVHHLQSIRCRAVWRNLWWGRPRRRRHGDGCCWHPTPTGSR